jgi:demethoxyubiquinone hydroxylase (CLK1/Coq7/Cat5 family)
MPTADPQKSTAKYLRDLHARERMRLAWYRRLAKPNGDIQQLRERKARQSAFLHDLLRRRGLKPSFQSYFYYSAGAILGWLTIWLPHTWAVRLENTLEYWIHLRYRKYHRSLSLQQNLRTMVEAMQLRKLQHNEPGTDVLQVLETGIRETAHTLGAVT